MISALHHGLPETTSFTGTTTVPSCPLQGVPPHGLARPRCLPDGTLSCSSPIGNTGPAILQIEQAKAVCRRCDVIETCLKWAIDTGQDSGVWGGLSEDERRALKRRNAGPAAPAELDSGFSSSSARLARAGAPCPPPSSSPNPAGPADNEQALRSALPALARVPPPVIVAEPGRSSGQ